ncbi:hypothetical protein R3P38DRAFT_3342235 [Favolaschia claudopus]|uniref:Uncharacterized protein n=1 Tax=Favolaschia claudopus TaxID=2862362 RepID=A0AAW0E6F6_9AGAR
MIKAGTCTNTAIVQTQRVQGKEREKRNNSGTGDSTLTPAFYETEPPLLVLQGFGGAAARVPIKATKPVIPPSCDKTRTTQRRHGVLPATLKRRLESGERWGEAIGGGRSRRTFSKRQERAWGASVIRKDGGCVHGDASRWEHLRQVASEYHRGGRGRSGEGWLEALRVSYHLRVSTASHQRLSDDHAEATSKKGKRLLKDPNEKRFRVEAYAYIPSYSQPDGIHNRYPRASSSSSSSSSSSRRRPSASPPPSSPCPPAPNINARMHLTQPAPHHAPLLLLVARRTRYTKMLVSSRSVVHNTLSIPPIGNDTAGRNLGHGSCKEEEEAQRKSRRVQIRAQYKGMGPKKVVENKVASATAQTLMGDRVKRIFLSQETLAPGLRMRKNVVHTDHGIDKPAVFEPKTALSRQKLVIVLVSPSPSCTSGAPASIFVALSSPSSSSSLPPPHLPPQPPPPNPHPASPFLTIDRACPYSKLQTISVKRPRGRTHDTTIRDNGGGGAWDKMRERRLRRGEECVRPKGGGTEVQATRPSHGFADVLVRQDLGGVCMSGFGIRLDDIDARSAKIDLTRETTRLKRRRKGGRFNGALRFTKDDDELGLKLGGRALEVILHINHENTIRDVMVEEKVSLRPRQRRPPLRMKALEESARNSRPYERCARSWIESAFIKNAAQTNSWTPEFYGGSAYSSSFNWIVSEPVAGNLQKK